MSTCQPHGTEHTRTTTTAATAATADNWRPRAACREADPSTAWPRNLADTFTRRHCARCPVIDRCARHADEHHAEGTWAGAHRRREDRSALDSYTVVTYLTANAPRHICARRDCPEHANDVRPPRP